MVGHANSYNPKLFHPYIQWLTHFGSISSEALMVRVSEPRQVYISDSCNEASDAQVLYNLGVQPEGGGSGEYITSQVTA